MGIEFAYTSPAAAGNADDNIKVSADADVDDLRAMVSSQYISVRESEVHFSTKARQIFNTRIQHIFLVSELLSADTTVFMERLVFCPSDGFSWRIFGSSFKNSALRARKSDTHFR